MRNMTQYTNPNDLCKHSIAVYLDYLGIAPVETSKAINYSGYLNSTLLRNWKNRVLKYKAIRHLFFEILDLEYKLFFSRFVL